MNRIWATILHSVINLTCSFVMLEIYLPSRYAEISVCGFDLYFPSDWWYWTSCLVPRFKFFAHFLIKLLSPCCWVVGSCIFFVIVSYQMYELWIFSAVLLFALLLVSFGAQEVSTLMKSNLWFFFPFVACAYGIVAKKSLSNPGS